MKSRHRSLNDGNLKDNADTLQKTLIKLSYFGLAGLLGLTMISCSVEESAEAPIVNSEKVEEDSEQTETPTDESKSKTDGEEEEEKEETTESTTQTTTSTLPTNGRTVEFSGLSILAATTSLQLLGLDAEGGGMIKVAYPTKQNFDQPKPSAGKLYSILDEAHWKITTDGVQFYKGSFDQTKLDASTKIAFPTGIDENSKVIGVTSNAIILTSSTAVASMMADGTVKTDNFPTGFSAPIAGGRISGSEGFWLTTTTSLIYYAPPTAGGTYTWSDPIDVTYTTPDGETVKHIYMTVTLAGTTAKFGSVYYILTDKQVSSQTVSNAGEGGSTSEVGS